MRSGSLDVPVPGSARNIIGSAPWCAGKAERCSPSWRGTSLLVNHSMNRLMMTGPFMAVNCGADEASAPKPALPSKRARRRKGRTARDRSRLATPFRLTRPIAPMRCVVRCCARTARSGNGVSSVLGLAPRARGETTHSSSGRVSARGPRWLRERCISSDGAERASEEGRRTWDHVREGLPVRRGRRLERLALVEELVAVALGRDRRLCVQKSQSLTAQTLRESEVTHREDQDDRAGGRLFAVVIQGALTARAGSSGSARSKLASSRGW